MVIFGYAYHQHTPTSIYKFTWAYAIDNAYHSHLVCQTDIALLYSNDNDNDSHSHSHFRGGGWCTIENIYIVPTQIQKSGIWKMPPKLF
jgi:hypothetical protein